MMAVLDFLYGMAVVGLIGSLVVIAFVCSWSVFEDTELWGMIRDRIERKEE